MQLSFPHLNVVVVLAIHLLKFCNLAGKRPQSLFKVSNLVLKSYDCLFLLFLTREGLENQLLDLGINLVCYYIQLLKLLHKQFDEFFSTSNTSIFRL